MKRILLLMFLGILIAQKPTQRSMEATDWLSVLDTDLKTWDHTLLQLEDYLVTGAFNYLWIINDGDTIKLDARTALYIIDIEVDNTRIIAINRTGNVCVIGDLTITGDDLFMTTNTTGFILRADGTNYNPVKFDDSADLAGFLDDETGTLLAVFSDSPSFSTQITTPDIVVTAYVLISDGGVIGIT